MARLLIFPCHSYLNRWKSAHGFNSERTRRTDDVDSTVARYVDWFVLFVWMSRLLTFSCRSFWPDDNQLTGSIPSELGELKSLTLLKLSTWIGLSSCSYECHPCSHFLAVLFDQIKIILLATSIRSFVMDHYWIWRFLILIALLKLCAAAALAVLKNADKETYSVINKDYIVDDRHTI
jgi:hypothetical protein